MNEIPSFGFNLESKSWETISALCFWKEGLILLFSYIP